MTEPGPVSAHLEADLREQARQHGILVWLDKEGTHTDFAAALWPLLEPQWKDPKKCGASWRTPRQ